MCLGSSEKELTFLGCVAVDKRRESQSSWEMLTQPLSTVLMHYFNYNREVLPRRTRISNKLRLQSIKIECTKRKKNLLSSLCNFYSDWDFYDFSSNLIFKSFIWLFLFLFVLNYYYYFSSISVYHLGRGWKGFFFILCKNWSYPIENKGFYISYL